MIQVLCPISEKNSSEPFEMINQALAELDKYAQIDKAVREVLDQVTEFRDVLHIRSNLPCVIINQMEPRQSKQLLVFSLGSIQKLENLAQQFFHHYDSSNRILREYLFKFYQLAKERAEGESGLGGEDKPLPNWFWLESPEIPLVTDEQLNSVAAAYAFLDEQEHRLSNPPRPAEPPPPEPSPCCATPLIMVKKIFDFSLRNK